MFPTYSEVISGVAPHIERVETSRTETANAVKLHAIILAGALVLVLLLLLSDPAVFVFGIIAWIIYLIVVFIIINKKYQKLRLMFKEQVVWGLASELLRLTELPGETENYRYDCKYNHNARMSDRAIEESRLFNYSIDKIRGEDWFQGRLGLTDFEFSELALIQVRTSTNSKGQTTRRDVTMFDGILFMADFHKDFEGVTILRSANIFNTGAVASWMQPLKNMFSFFQSEKKHSINLEDEEFNRAFDVQTTDEIKARYLLTSSMMERILEFKKRHKEKVEISFVHSRMFLALSSGNNYFEPKLLQPIREAQTELIYYDLVQIFGMVEDFDLNTRIWSKT